MPNNEMPRLLHVPIERISTFICVRKKQSRTMSYVVTSVNWRPFVVSFL